MFIEMEETPNPATLKFLPGCSVMGSAQPREFAIGQGSPLADVLLADENIASIFMGRDFISVTKADDADWFALKPVVLSTILDHFTAGRLVVDNSIVVDAAPIILDEISLQIQELLETRVRPAVAQDGGDIVFDRFEDGVVYVYLRGACSGCPSSTMTLKAGIENMLRHYIPEIEEVRAI